MRETQAGGGNNSDCLHASLATKGSAPYRYLSPLTPGRDVLKKQRWLAQEIVRIVVLRYLYVDHARVFYDTITFFKNKNKNIL